MPRCHTKNLALLTLFDLYPFLSFLEQNKQQLDFHLIYTVFFLFCITLIFSFLGYAIILTAVSILTRKQKDYSTLSCFLLIFFTFFLFNFNSILDSVRLLTSITFCRRLIYLSILICTVIIFYFYKKIQSHFLRLALILNALLLSSTLYSVLFTAKHEFKLDNKYIYNKQDNIPVSNKAWDNNVYLIICDGYPRSDLLRLHTGYDNSQMIGYLKRKGFSVLNDSVSNYPFTLLSLQSLLSAKYTYDKKSSGYNVQEAFNAIGGNNAVVRKFMEKGYKYIHVGNGIWSGSFCRNPQAKCVEKTNNFCTSFTKLFNLSQEVFTIFVGKIPFLRDFFSPENMIVSLDDVHDYLSVHYKKKHNEPWFFFAHTLPPHPPFIFEKNCKIKENFKGSNLGDWKNNKTQFIEHLQCVDSQIEKLVTLIVDNDPSAIIALVSDHGTGFTVNWEDLPQNWSSQIQKERFSNLIAIRGPEETLNYLYPSMSLVNVFPFIFAILDNESPVYLEDKSYISVDTSITSFQGFHEAQRIK